MNNQEPNKNNTSFFYERYSGQSDEEILKILRFHKNYQEAAVAAAVKIALERELIHSEQDLLSPEFQHIPAHRLSIFPAITNTWHQKRLIGSIFRFLYLLSLLPLIYGVMNYADGQLEQALEGIGLGIIWAVFCFLFRKNRKRLLLSIMILILAVIFVMGSIRVINQENLKILDLLLVITGTVLPAYLLLYVNRLLQINQEKD